MVYRRTVAELKSPLVLIVKTDEKRLGEEKLFMRGAFPRKIYILRRMNMKKAMKRLVALGLALAMVFAFGACSSEQEETKGNVADGEWAPDGPVTMIVSYKAGNGTDVTARVLAQYAEKYIGQTIVIENVDGGSGSIGWSQLAGSDADGMTIGFMNLPNFNSSIVKELGTYTTADFAAICNHVTETSLVLVRANDDRFNSLQDLVDYGKAHQGELIASTNGAQASNHIGAQAFANSAGFTYIDLPKGNTADELLSLRGEEADFCVAKVADIVGMESELKILGVFAEERLAEYPDVPTLGELGFYDKWLGSSRCIVAPAGVSDEVIAFYEAAFKATMEDADYLEASKSFATDYKNAADTAALIEQQQAFTEGLADGFWYE